MPKSNKKHKKVMEQSWEAALVPAVITARIWLSPHGYQLSIESSATRDNNGVAVEMCCQDFSRTYDRDYAWLVAEAKGQLVEAMRSLEHDRLRLRTFASDRDALENTGAHYFEMK